MQNVYTIPADEIESVSKELTKLSKKASKYSKSLEFSVGEPYVKSIPVYYADGEFCESVLAEVADIAITSDIIKQDGYTVIAKIEHLDGGNIVSVLDGASNPEWSKIPAKCDHCGGKHGQKTTYIVQRADGAQKQVGRTCLRDYCGIDPQSIGIVNQIEQLVIADDLGSYYETHAIAPVYRIEDALCAAVHLISKQGYRKADEVESNKSKMQDCIEKERDEWKKNRQYVQEMMKNVKSFKTDSDEFLSNLVSFVNCGYCKPQHLGKIAYMPIAYTRYIEREQKAEQLKEKSGYVGTIGERVEFEVKNMTLLTSFLGDYGYTYLYKMTDQNDNVFIWFASKQIAEGAKTIKGTVKSHSERNGEMQTVITRCKAE